MFASKMERFEQRRALLTVALQARFLVALLRLPLRLPGLERRNISVAAGIAPAVLIQHEEFAQHLCDGVLLHLAARTDQALDRRHVGRQRVLLGIIFSDAATVGRKRITLSIHDSESGPQWVWARRVGTEALMAAIQAEALVYHERYYAKPITDGRRYSGSQFRAQHRDLLADLYEQTVQPYIDRVREQMAVSSEGAIKAALVLANALPTGSTSAQMMLVAAVEIVEPTQRAAQGDEPVREQRQVTGHGLGDQPDGDGSASDPLYDKAVAVVRANQRASISLIQRHLRIGYNRAARLLEAMEGTVVGRLIGGNRKVLLQGGVT